MVPRPMSRGGGRISSAGSRTPVVTKTMFVGRRRLSRWRRIVRRHVQGQTRFYPRHENHFRRPGQREPSDKKSKKAGPRIIVDIFHLSPRLASDRSPRLRGPATPTPIPTSLLRYRCGRETLRDRTPTVPTTPACRTSPSHLSQRDSTGPRYPPLSASPWTRHATATVSSPPPRPHPIDRPRVRVRAHARRNPDRHRELQSSRGRRSCCPPLPGPTVGDDLPNHTSSLPLSSLVRSRTRSRRRRRVTTRRGRRTSCILRRRLGGPLGSR